MNEGFHITRSSQPASSHEIRVAKKRSEDFLDVSAGEENECDGCTTKDFCNATITRITSELSSREIRDHAQFLGSHGIEISAEQSICPGVLARLAIQQVRSGSFWVAETDPLRHSSERLQVGETLVFATQTLFERIKNGQAL